MLYQRQLFVLIAFALFLLPALTYGAAENTVAGSIKEMTVKEAAQVLKQQNVVIVDVRTPEEFKAGHLPGAINCNLFGTRFDEQVEKLAKDKPVLVYCRTGKRSAGAADIFKEAGHNVLHMHEGVEAWQKAKLPIAKD